MLIYIQMYHLNIFLHLQYLWKNNENCIFRSFVLKQPFVMFISEWRNNISFEKQMTSNWYQYSSLGDKALWEWSFQWEVDWHYKNIVLDASMGPLMYNCNHLKGHWYLGIPQVLSQFSVSRKKEGTLRYLIHFFEVLRTLHVVMLWLMRYYANMNKSLVICD